MLNYQSAFGSFSVDDIEAAKKFYDEMLGLKVTEGEYGVLEIHTQGNNPIIVYPKEDHVPATYTVFNFVVNDIEKTVDDLTEKGILFEQYTGELQTNEKGISEWEGGPKMAWFKDPAGNFLALMQEK